MSTDDMVLDRIRASSENGSADWDDPIGDCRWLLAEVDRLQSELADAEQHERVFHNSECGI